MPQMSNNLFSHWQDKNERRSHILEDFYLRGFNSLNQSKNAHRASMRFLHCLLWVLQILTFDNKQLNGNRCR